MSCMRAHLTALQDAEARTGQNREASSGPTEAHATTFATRLRNGFKHAHVSGGGVGKPVPRHHSDVTRAAAHRIRGMRLGRAFPFPRPVPAQAAPVPITTQLKLGARFPP